MSLSPELDRPVDQADYSVKTSPLVPKLVLEIDGDRAEFLAHAKINQWALMMNAESAKTRDNISGMAAMYRLATTTVKAEDRERFEDFMLTHGTNDDLVEVLGDALDLVWRGESMLPLEPASSDSSASSGPSSSTSEGSSSPPATEAEWKAKGWKAQDGGHVPLRLALPPMTPEDEEMAGSSSQDYR